MAVRYGKRFKALADDLDVVVKYLSALITVLVTPQPTIGVSTSQLIQLAQRRTISLLLPGLMRAHLVL
jgi:hypothetical protein